MPLEMKNTGREEAVADGVELGAELGVLAQRAAVEHAEEGAGDEGAEDRLQPDLLRQHDEQRHAS